MCIRFIISSKSKTEWLWSIVKDGDKVIASSTELFATRYECIENAETFRDTLNDAAFYDDAGVRIPNMHLSK